MSAKNSEESLSGSQNRRITWEGCSVLLDINDGDRVLFARLTAGSKIKIGNNSCSLQPLIGCPFGSSFQVEVGGDGPFLSRVIPSTEGNNVVEKMDSQIMEERRDNRAIVDNNTAQTLTGEEIDDMRSLIIAAPDMDVWGIAKELVPLLSYSAPLVIYHQYLQPLASCMHNLQSEKMAIGLQLSEPWLREYQVCLIFHPSNTFFDVLLETGSSIKDSSTYADELIRGLSIEWHSDNWQ
ncbi:UNVERIFIED_CONTAM: tRNA (adenine(58)-N(1))-methyltransferase non-catalytic subunit trm6 [Sesamum latifolium]|uniref:tRNA (adenine(58)-N(1))-methyltransferase non-catalytic subunit TRM6 n=1 Tax=Sesamum latifolium TaxID=2727402 RepID=A0AAW2WAQ9_9LAMI